MLDTNIVGCLWLEEFDLWYEEFLFRVGLILDQYLKFVPHTLLSMRPPPTLLKHRIAKVTGLELCLGFIKGLGVGALNKVLGFRGFSEFVSLKYFFGEQPYIVSIDLGPRVRVALIIGNLGKRLSGPIRIPTPDQTNAQSHKPNIPYYLRVE